MRDEHLLLSSVKKINSSKTSLTFLHLPFESMKKVGLKVEKRGEKVHLKACENSVMHELKFFRLEKDQN